MIKGLKNILVKIKSLLIPKKLATVAVSTLLIALFALSYTKTASSPADGRQISFALNGRAQKTLGTLADVSTLSNPGAYKDLPVSSVTYHPTADRAKGTAILIPQYHLDPASNPQDPSNDSAVKNQKQISQVFSYLDKQGVNMVMVEGDLAGDVPQSKIDKITKEKTLADQLTNQQDALNAQMQSAGWNQRQIDSVNSSISNKATQASRDVILKGGAYYAKSQGVNLTLVGAEDQDALDKAAGVVRNYIYLTDRMNQLQGPQQSPQMALGQPQKQPMAQMQQSQPQNPLMSVLGQSGKTPAGIAGLTQLLSLLKPSSAQQLASAESYAKSQGNTQLSQGFVKVQDLLGQLADAAKPIPNPNQKPTPSRADNPYANISDPNLIKQKLDESQTEINSVVIGERNKTAAANFAKALTDHGQSVGAIQFGAGHEQGLVDELNKQGINVIVVTTNEVAARNSTGV